MNRERVARREAEKLLEEKALDLYQANIRLQKLNKTLEDTIDERTAILQSLIRNFHGGVLVETASRHIYLTNKSFCDIFSIPANPEELLGVDCSGSAEQVKNLFKEPEIFVRRILKLLRDQNPCINEELELADGRVFERDFVPIYVKGVLNGYFWNYRDVTEKKKSELKIRRSEEKYRGIIENMELGLMEVDNNQTIQKAYQGFCEMTGYKQEDLIGNNAVDMFLPANFKEEMEKQDAERKKGKAGVYEIQMKKANGQKMWVLISGAPFYDLKGNILGSIGIHYDITDRKDLEEDLKAAKLEADLARKAEKKFLANMSHEIRNPLNAVIGMTNLLYDTAPNPEQYEYLNAIKHSSDLLLNIISDVLDIAKIEAGETTFNPREFNLKELSLAMANTFKQRAGEKNLKFKFFFDERIDNKVIGDQTIINQALINLLSNAVKFTEKGSVELKIEATEITDNYYDVNFVVIDTGIGIKPEHQTNIFKSFKQGDKDTKLKFGGTGLGLAITKELIKIHEGALTVLTEVNEGSSFLISLRLGNTGNKPEVTNNRLEVVNELDEISEVLIVEDNKINQGYLKKLLSKWGISSEIANHGQEALNIIDNRHFDLILMDIRMPVMDGYETVIRIRSLQNNPNAKIPIIALTASAMLEEKEKALSLGFNLHLTKPFSPDQLKKALLKLSPKQKMTEVNSFMDYQFHPEFDVQILHDYYNGDLKYITGMFSIFIKNTPEDQKTLKKHFGEDNWIELGRIAHKMKSTFGMIGFPEISNLCQEIEDMCNQEDFIAADLYKTYAELVSSIDHLLPLVEQEKKNLDRFNQEKQTA